MPFAMGMGDQARGVCFSWWFAEFFLPSVIVWHMWAVFILFRRCGREPEPLGPNFVGLPDNADRDVVREHQRLIDPNSADRQSSAFAALSLRQVFPAPCCLCPRWLCPREARNDEEDEEEMVERANQGQEVDADAKYREDKIALRCVTFGVRRGECFGLLGPNGAGKTTVVSALTHSLDPTEGEPWVNGAGHELRADEFFRAARIGTVTQGNAVMLRCSAVESMRFALRTRLGPLYGADEDWEGYIHAALAKVKFDDADEAKDKQAGAFSGGMLRRLAVALALYTGAENVFLDEPSSAMDPYARRSLWTAIREASALRRSTLLTTHSMEEADAVCDRVAIVTKGDLRCIGTTSHLKQRFAAGYTIVLTLHQARPEATKILPSVSYAAHAVTHDSNLPEALVAQQGPMVGTAVDDGHSAHPHGSGGHECIVMANTFPPPPPPQATGPAGLSDVFVPYFVPEEVPETPEGDSLQVAAQRHAAFVDAQVGAAFGRSCVLKEEIGLQRRYTVTDLPSVAMAFQVLADRKEQWALDNYTVSQLTTLEQVFLEFTQKSKALLA
uniref:ABC transporter domain-containing protein n=1 Tax=Neobodo designis TaxID=312471 RepID=A0A7S1LGE2_NEODS